MILIRVHAAPPRLTTRALSRWRVALPQRAHPRHFQLGWRPTFAAGVVADVVLIAKVFWSPDCPPDKTALKAAGRVVPGMDHAAVMPGLVASWPADSFSATRDARIPDEINKLHGGRHADRTRRR